MTLREELRRRVLSTVLNAVVIIAAIGVGLWVAREMFPARSATTTAASELPERLSRAEWLQVRAHRLGEGPTDARVHVINFSDYQCPACAEMHERLRALRARHPSSVLITQRHFPLEQIHRAARDAAVAAECANDQGRFSAVHAALYANQDSIGRVPWTFFAIAGHVPDVGAYEQCIQQPRHHARIKDDVTLGERLGVRSTPTLIINGIVYRTLLEMPQLDSIVARQTR